MIKEEFIKKLLIIKGEVEITFAEFNDDKFHCSYMLPYNYFEFDFDTNSIDIKTIIKELNGDINENLEEMSDHCLDCKDTIVNNFTGGLK